MSSFARAASASAVLAFVAASAWGVDYGRTNGAFDVSGGSANSVTFDAGANNRWVTNAIAGEVGVRVNGYNYSSWDAVPNLIGLNGNPFSMIGSFLALPLLFTDQSPHSEPTPSWGHH